MTRGRLQLRLLIDDKGGVLTPDMAVTMEIKTEAPRAIDLLLSPLREVAAQAGRER